MSKTVVENIDAIVKEEPENIEEDNNLGLLNKILEELKGIRTAIISGNQGNQG